MEVILLSKEEYQNIMNTLNDIKLQLDNSKKNLNDLVIDNDEFLKRMKISRRTAQAWRDEGKISFSQIGGKIYYKLSDLDDLLNRNSRKAQAPVIRA